MLVFALAPLALGCAPTASLSTRPDTVCAGRAVRLTWRASHSGEITAEPPGAAPGDVGESGVETVRPKATTTYRLRVSSLLGSAVSEATVKVLTLPDEPTPVSGSVSDDGSGCSPGRIWVTARIPPDAWDSRLRVSQVSSPDGRAYLVQHAARSAQVGAEAPSDELRDLPIAGAWRLETALRAGEACGETTAPESLAVSVSFVCAD